MNPPHEAALAFTDVCRDLLQCGLCALLLSTLVLAVAFLARLLWREHGPVARCLMDRATLVAVVACLLLPPLVGGRLPSAWPVFLPSAGNVQRATSSSPQIAHALNGSFSELQRIPVMDRSAPGHMAVLPSPRPGLTAWTWIYGTAVGVWLLGTLWLLARLAISQVWIVQALRAGRPLHDGPARRALEALCAARHVPPPPLVASSQVGSPFLAFARRPMIFLPALWEADLDETALRAVLSHEVGT